MIKMLSKLFVFTVFSALLATPTLGLAQAQQRGTPSQTASNVCARLVTSAAKLNQQLMEREAKLAERITERLNKANARKLNHETKQAERLTQRQERFQEQYEKLLESAGNEAQKQAVAEFRLAIESARNTKNATLQNAINSWQEAVQKTLANRNAAAAEATIDFKNAIKAATDKATADCQTDANPATVRSTLMSSLEAARDKFKSDRQTMNNLGKTLEEERGKRQEEVKKAVADYKAAVQTAMTKLRATLGENGEEPEDSEE